MNMAEWAHAVAVDERRGGDALEYFDAANEDAQGRLPHEPGYGQGAEVIAGPFARHHPAFEWPDLAA